ncbi:shugoshin 2 [Kryptolebias marmoratus]|uniref:shugoshin 2 n=1 Tax=Kryptolebias marmoratus TaxID=37003 RepID=UPI0007F940A5|nr:shugoshin 2 [Kryptolebias marmoratus]
MIPLKRTTPSKQTSAVASKIKNKILNTSSFFKVSLKTNNKALALALQAQKERSRQLEMEVVYLQKQVESLCFELATKKYTEKKLLLILKSLQSNTLQHVEMMEGLVSGSGSQRPIEDCRRLTGNNWKHDAAERATEQLPMQPEISEDLLSANKNMTATANSPERNADKDVVHVLKRCSNDKSDVEKVDSRPLTGSSHLSSSSLSDEVERLSMVFSQSDLNRKSVLGSRKSQTSENPTPPLPVENNPVSVSGSGTESQLTQPEKTVLLNSTMEMTVSEAAEIVTVETKAKKKKGKQIQKKGCGSSAEGLKSLDLRPNEANVESFLQTHQREESLEEVLDSRLLQKPSRNIKASRIPRLGNNQNASGNKSKFCDTALVNMEDYFADPEVELSKVIGRASEKDATVDASSKVTLRKSRTKVKRQSVVFQKPLLSLSCQDDESRQSGQELVHNEDEGDFSHPQQLQEFPFCAEKVAQPESGPVDRLSPGGGMKKRRKTKCRIFVISVCRDSISPNLDQDLMPPAGSRSEREEPLTVGGQHSESEPQTKTRSSRKRSHVETPEYSNEVLPTDQHSVSGSEFHKPKKAKQEEAGHSSKKKEVVLEGDFVPSNNTQKKKKTNSNNRLRSEQEVNEPPICITDDPEIRNEQALHSIKDQDISKRPHNSKHMKSKADPKLHRKTSKPLTATETRNPRETFEKKDYVFPKGFDASGKAVHRNVGDLLMDELPPWTLDMKSADTESSSLPSTPSRALVTEESVAVTTEASPAGRVLTMVTNTMTTSDSETRGRRRRNCVVSYKEPPLNRKLRRGDEFT